MHLCDFTFSVETSHLLSGVSGGILREGGRIILELVIYWGGVRNNPLSRGRVHMVTYIL